MLRIAGSRAWQQVAYRWVFIDEQPPNPPVGKAALVPLAVTAALVEVYEDAGTRTRLEVEEELFNLAFVVAGWQRRNHPMLDMDRWHDLLAATARDLDIQPRSLERVTCGQRWPTLPELEALAVNQTLRSIFEGLLGLDDVVRQPSTVDWFDRDTILRVFSTNRDGMVKLDGFAANLIKDTTRRYRGVPDTARPTMGLHNWNAIYHATFAHPRPLDLSDRTVRHMIGSLRVEVWLVIQENMEWRDGGQFTIRQVREAVNDDLRHRLDRLAPFDPASYAQIDRTVRGLVKTGKVTPTGVRGMYQRTC